jgi:hypothetical protein
MGATGLVVSVLVDDQDRAAILVRLCSVDHTAIVLQADRWGAALAACLTGGESNAGGGAWFIGFRGIRLEQLGNRRGLAVQHLPGPVPVVS